MIVFLIIVIFLFLIVIGALSYLVYNMYRKNEIYETYIESFAATIENILAELKSIDSKGSFQADDEVGFFFSALKRLLQKLSDFRTLRR